MKRITAEWVEKAEGDYAVALRESRVRKSPNPDAICFHAQQCAEKYLKGRLAEAGTDFGKTHNLVTLLDQVLPVEPLWESFRADLVHLSVFAAAFRYPGESADRNTAKDAFKRCKRFRAAARTALGPKPR